MKHFWIALTFVFLKSFVCHAQQNFGLGIVIGDPTGITAKYEVSRANAVDAAVSFGSHDVYLHGTWQWLMPKLFNLDRYPVNWYFGLGARLISHDHDHKHGPFGHGHDDDHDDDDVHLGARAPIGLRMNFTNPKIEIFTEISLAMDIVPDMDADLDFGIGTRYYF